MYLLIEAKQASVFDLVLVLIASGMPRCANLSAGIQSAWLTNGVFPIDHIESMMRRQPSNEVSLRSPLLATTLDVSISPLLFVYLYFFLYSYGSDLFPH